MPRRSRAQALAPGLRQRFWLTLPALVIGCLLAAHTPVHADPGQIGRVVEARGELAVRHADGDVLDSPRGRDLRNSPVLQGDRVRTGWKARAELDLGEGRLRLDEDTEIAVRRLDGEHVDIVLERGQVVLEVRRDRAARQWRIETAVGLHLPEGAGLFRIEAPPRRRDLAGAGATAWRSSLRILGEDGSTLQLPAGRRIEIDQDQQWSIGLPTADGFARWAMAPPSGGWEGTPEQAMPYPPPPVYWEPAGPAPAPQVIVLPPMVIEREPGYRRHMPPPPPPRPPVVVMPPQPLPAQQEPHWHQRQAPPPQFQRPQQPQPMPPHQRMQPQPSAPVVVQPMPQQPRAVPAPSEPPPRPDRRHHDDAVRVQPPVPAASAPGGRSQRAF